MLDPAFVRDHMDAVRAGLTSRGLKSEADLDQLFALESRRRQLLPEVEGLKREQNAAGDEVARAKRQGLDPSAIFATNKTRARKIKQLEVELEEVEQARLALLMTLPNLPDASVPVGASAADNQEVRRHGAPPVLDFEAKAHWDLGPALGILDFERATRMSGARFSVLIGAGARLARALINFMLELHTQEHGYTEVEPPFLVNADALRGTGNLPKFEQDLFKIAGEWDLYLIPTAEVPLTNLHRTEILDGRLLPLRYTAYTPCFRSEAGSYGADVRGLIRQHQFDKVELVKFTTPDQSFAELESLVANAEEVLERLGLPFRLGDLHLLGDLADASTEATAAIAAQLDYFEKELAPKSKGTFRLGREKFEQKFQLDEGLALGADRLLSIAMRELQSTQEEFRRVASRLNGGDPMAAWQRAKQEHPPAGQLVPTAQQQVEELQQFIQRERIVSLPEGVPVAVLPTPRFYRWTSASMWTPGPFEVRAQRAFYYITDVDPAWPAERQAEHLRDFSYGALWAISMHEVFPGHFLHYQHLRQIDAKLRKSILFSSTAFVEGWAHYCEQMMVDEGFRKSDPTIRLGQLAEALVRLCRTIVGIRLHCEDLSVEQGVRFFRDEAFLEEVSARREAERGTFDPAYILYSAGKLMLLKLRDDYKAHVGAKYSLRGFHDTLLANGTVPLWLHRALLLGEQNGEMIE